MDSQTMTISQALRRVKRLKGRYSELSQRATGSVSYEQGKKPVFDFAATRGEMAKVREELVVLEAAIAVGNAEAIVEYAGKHMTLAEAIRRLQEFKTELAWLARLELRSGTEVGREIDYDESIGRNVPRRIETTYISDLSEIDRANEVERLREQFEELNDLVESANRQSKVRVPNPS